ncbi:MAG TPA: LysR family transcriptional regulator [Acidimicrobiia bacterium]|jgi:DNA-binding transcriptional LysR family regulator
MDLRRLGLFLAVAEHGSFTAGARAAHVAQPAVSLAIRELETELGADLFVRGRRGAALTAAGEALLEPARQALRDIETAAAAVAAVTGLVAGDLDVASLATLAADPVAPIIGRFRSEHPGVIVRLMAPTDPVELADAVAAGHAEVGVTEQGAANERLHEVPLYDQDLMLVSPPGRATEPGMRPISLRALADEPLVLTEPGSSLRVVVDRALESIDRRANCVVETAQREALVPLVLAGAGSTVLPAQLASNATLLGAIVRDIKPPLRRRVVVVHREGALSPAARAFLDATFAE